MSTLARWWKPLENGKILCTLCPRYCKIGPGQSGFCFIRQNINGSLYSAGYGHPTGFAIDPIEKKPLNHFFPGSSILSFGTAGCNLGCKFCQNWSISKARLDVRKALDIDPAKVIELALEHNTPSIAYTYNDPTIFGEYVYDISRLAREAGIKSVMVTAGYIDRDARKDVYRYIDAANVDLKAFSERFYHKLTFSHLADVLDTIRWLKKETGIWVELTTLIIPGENDDMDELARMCDWILENLGDTTPLHFTAFHPDFRMSDHTATPTETLFKARKLAIKKGLKYCYLGNVLDREGQSTVCPSCKTTVIERSWHTVHTSNLNGDLCGNCGYHIDGVFSEPS